MGDQTEPGTTSAASQPNGQAVDLPLVGPAPAAAIEEASFDAADIAERRVSYVMLREAGINPGVAGRMRRRYSLVWSFRWRFGGEDLPDRAAQVRGLQPTERSWVDESSRPVEDGDDPAIAAWNDWIDASFADEDDGTPPDQCPRCGSAFATYTMGERERVHCEDCGYAAVSVARTRSQRATVPDESPQSWVAVLEQFRTRFRENESGES